MSHFAKIDDDNIVTQVVVAEQDYIDSIKGSIIVPDVDPPEVSKPNWVQTSYNTRGGVHYCAQVEYVTEAVEAKPSVKYIEGDVIPEGKKVGMVRIPAVKAKAAVYVEGKSPEDVGKPDGGVALRKNYAGVGYTYDKDKDAFIPPKPFASWVLDEDSCLWEAPVAKPDIIDEEDYSWDEDNQEWVEVPDIPHG